jgi:hypothetical protein
MIDTLHDLSGDGVLDDAEHALARAQNSGGEAALAAWARAWGPAFVGFFRSPEAVRDWLINNGLANNGDWDDV